jgi:hypothetical protein
MTRGRTATIKRATGHLVVFALLGVVMSYVVAWGCLLDSRPFGKTSLEGLTMMSDANGRLLLAFGLDCPFGVSARQVSSSARSYFEFGGTKCYSYSLDIFPGGSAGKDWPDWLTETWGMRPEAAAFDAVWYAAGFPMRCCAGIYTENLQPPQSRNHFVVSLWGAPTRFCYGPTWPGLFLNTAFYGAIPWLLWFTSGVLRLNTRRSIRRRRGLCVRCGYDLRSGATGGACPECGG